MLEGIRPTSSYVTRPKPASLLEGIKNQFKSDIAGLVAFFKEPGPPQREEETFLETVKSEFRRRTTGVTGESQDNLWRGVAHSAFLLLDTDFRARISAQEDPVDMAIRTVNTGLPRSVRNTSSN